MKIKFSLSNKYHAEEISDESNDQSYMDGECLIVSNVRAKEKKCA